MNSAASVLEPSGWLVEEGLKEMALLFRAILSHQSEPILIADLGGHCLDASSGAAQLLGVPGGKLIGERVDHLLAPDKLHHITNSDVLPGRHVLAFNNKSAEKDPTGESKDYAFFSL